MLRRIATRRLIDGTGHLGVDIVIVVVVVVKFFDAPRPVHVPCSELLLCQTNLAAALVEVP